MKTKLLAIALLAISCQAHAEAEKFCDTSEIVEKLNKEYQYSHGPSDKKEEVVRKKCKAGDIIWIGNIDASGSMSARLCDFRFHIDENVCILAPPRETY